MMLGNQCLFANVAKRKGQAVLPLIFMMGGLVVLMSLTLVFLAYTFLESSYGFQISEKAKAVAASGAYDALLRLARNKDLSAPAPGYSLPIGNYSANVSVLQNSPASDQATIISVSTISNRERKVVAIVSRPSLTGEITLVSWSYAQ